MVRDDVNDDSYARLTSAASRMATALEAISRSVAPGADAVDELVAEASVALEALLVADEELKVQAAELASSGVAMDAERERYAELFELLPDAVLETDAEGKIIDANEAACALLQVPRRWIVAKLLTSFVESADRRRMRRLMMEVPSSGELLLRIVDRQHRRHLVGVTVRRRQHGVARSERLLWAIRDLSQVSDLAQALERRTATAQAHGRLATMQRLLGAHDPLAALLDRVLASTSTLCPGYQTAVAIADEAAPASSGEVAAELARIEADVSAGPSHDAATNARPISATGVELGRRWPHVGGRALELGARAVYAVPVMLDGEPLGALVAWRLAAAEHNFDEVFDVMAGHLAIAAANARLYQEASSHGTHLERALEYRGAIEQAKGMLMYERGIDENEAFDVLREISQRHNRKLRAVAVELIAETNARRTTAPNGRSGRSD